VADSRPQWDHYAKKETKQGGDCKGNVKPLTTYLHRTIQLFVGGFILTAFSVRFRALPLLCHLSINSMLTLCQRSMELPRYITAVGSVFCQKSTLSLPLSPHKVTEHLRSQPPQNANEAHPNTQLLAHRSGCFIYTFLSTLCPGKKNHRLMTPRLDLLAAFQPKTN